MGRENHNEELELALLIEKIKGRLDLVASGKDHLKELLKLYQESQDALNTELKKRLLKQENCPCQVRRDPSCQCPLLNLQQMVAKYVGIGVGAGFLIQVLIQIGLHFYFR